MAYERTRRQKYPTKNFAYQMKEVTLDGSNPTPITMDLLKQVKFAVAVYKGTGAPALEAAGLNVDYSGSDNIVNLYAWAHTSSANPTLIASTNATRVVVVMALGSAR